MVQFTKLRLTGFKSFADATEIDIMPGLNGIVGPNGCGKSNLVEALRWLMGETSAKSLRGGEMDDVIFAGTGKRASRNFAEVVLTLKNTKGTAPEPYRSVDNIEISRRIDRGMGSDYRINGKIVRAGDVQLLFADSSTGASSPAIVSQGRVTALIQAKPVDRRRVLEDAAAISGLHNRRKEAETKLRAAEKNLTRVDDLLGQKTVLHEQLVKQAKQAERYRTLSDIIRRLEALNLVMEWQRVTQEIEAAQSSMVFANEAQNQAKQALYDLSKQRDGLQSRFDHVEREIQEQQKLIQQAQLQKERAQEELRRYEQTCNDLHQQKETAEQDIAYEVTALENATAKLQVLQEESQALQSRLANFNTEVEQSALLRDSTKEAFEIAQQNLNSTRTEQASLTAQRTMLTQQAQRAMADKANLQAERNRVADQVSQLQADLGGADIASLQTSLQQTETALQTHLDHVTDLEKQSESTTTATRQAFDALQAANAVLGRIDTEIKALAALAETPNTTQSFKTVLDQITVESGFEQALSVAMGRELRAGLNDTAPTYWEERNDTILTDLPSGATALYSVVKAPDALRTALSVIGVVADQATGQSLSAQLQIGQMLVSKDGYGWRWDGFTVTPHAAATAQERETKQLLEQRNRLTVLRQERIAADAHVTATKQQADHAQATQEALRQQTTATRQNLANTQRQLGQDRQALASAERRQADVQARFSAAQEKQQDLDRRLQTADENLLQVQEQLNVLPVEQEGQTALEALQLLAQEADSAYRQNDQNFVTLYAQQTQSQQRLTVTAQEMIENQQRADNATQRQQIIGERLAKINEGLAQLQSPDHVQGQIAAADSKLKEYETISFALNTQRQEVAQSRQTIDQQNQQQQEALMAAREGLVRAETQFHNGQSLLEQVCERAQQNMGCAVEEIAEQFTFSDEDLGQNIQVMRAKQERARAEREKIGAVNLRAEEESTLLGQEIATLLAEKDDVLQAIEKLRHGISTLNRDARKKMLTAFDDVNARFKEVFTRLFNGGEAYLQLIDAEDPLEAGLEIFAQPPGKRLQTLTLLSGGEQSLTAIALIFAMFLTQPSPICILDEIDAALDDANVERICSLLSDFAKTHPTRFLVITHNPITMAHLHRLYGVTMMEKGVSKLVSVDLERNNMQQHLAIAAE